MALFDLTGRVAIVTGGIGLGLTRAEAAVVIAGRNRAKTAWCTDRSLVLRSWVA